MRTNAQIAAQRRQNREHGGQRCSARAAFGKASLLSALPACLSSFLSWGLNLNCKGNVSSQGTGGEGRFGTTPQPDLAGVHPTSLAPLVARISFPPTPLHPCWPVSLPLLRACAKTMLVFLGQREEGSVQGWMFPHLLTHSFTHSFIRQGSPMP